MSKVMIYSPPSTAQIKRCSVDFDLRREPPKIYLVQYDKTLPVVEVALNKGGTAYQLPEDAEVNIRMGKRNKLAVYNPVLGCNEDRDRVYVEITTQMTTQEGVFDPILELLVGGGIAGTSPIQFIVQRNPVQDDAVEDETERKTIAEYARQASESASAAAKSAEDAGESVRVVQENEESIKFIQDNIEDIRQAKQNASEAADSATLSQSWAVGGTGTREGEDTDNAKYWCAEAQKVAQGALGWYENESALRSAHPTGQDGQWALVGDTDTIWTWDSDASDWINTATRIDLSNYYTKAQTDAQIKTAMSNTGTLVYGSSVTTGTVNNGGVGTIGTLKIPSAGVWMVAASGWKPDAIGKGIVSIDNIGGCSLSEYQFCLAGVIQCSGVTTMNLNVTNWSGNTVNGQQSAGLIFRAVKISG
ncbi:hypothetical protein H6B10_01025 [Gemmiger formicilis]|uniref:hypothetical protein n=1 Tax=Gemmiger formicilis TaxID=745368 RepID=UPI00195DD7D9|nr:hypothetical protein [Gemmiger formicilis]MBM6898299.1 hypothetical protein [Gemmiger formicilis]